MVSIYSWLSIQLPVHSDYNEIVKLYHCLLSGKSNDRHVAGLWRSSSRYGSIVFAAMPNRPETAWSIGLFS